MPPKPPKPPKTSSLSKSSSSRGSVCSAKLSFQECEMAILRAAIDHSTEEQQNSQRNTNGPEIEAMIEIVESFLAKKQTICYGGTAINNILPREVQFYNRSIDIPDYDFYSSNAMDDAKELADVFYQKGYRDVEAKTGVHHGTYKVFVNFIPIADITYLDSIIFQQLLKQSLKIAGIFYASPNWLRMGMYLELCRPNGDISRWEKVLTRLTLLNKYYPLQQETTSNQVKCINQTFQRQIEGYSTNVASKIHDIVRMTLINQNVVFFGGYAMNIYASYMPKTEAKLFKKIADFDVLAENIDKTAMIVVEQLQQAGFHNGHSIKHEGIGEILPEHVEIRVGKEIVAFIYGPTECVNYNQVIIEGVNIRIATIDTILRYYLAFIYTGRQYYDTNRLLCMSQFLFDVQQKNRLEQKGVLERFGSSCIGKQATIEDIRAEKAELFKKLSKDRNTLEYQEWFMKYIPEEKSQIKAPRKPRKLPKPKPKSKRRHQRHLKMKSQKARQARGKRTYRTTRKIKSVYYY